MSTPIVPNGRDEMIAFYKVHQPVWETNMLALGLTQPEIDEIKAKLTAALTQQETAAQARQNAQAQTLSLNQLADVLRATGALMMTRIRTYAESTNNPALYALAEIPAPKPPQPAGPPQTPTDFVADPLANGTITLTWKGSIAQGQDFPVERSIDGGPWTLRDTVRGKKWTDMAVPMNSNVIQYRIYGRRSDVWSNPPATATVNFGNLPAEILAAFRAGGNGAQGQAKAA